MNFFKKKFIHIFIFLGVCFYFSPVVNAQVEAKASINSIVREYKEKSSEWQTEIASAATWLFWTLAIIDLTWLAMMMLFKKQDMLDFLGGLIQRIIIIGFFWILLVNGTAWSKAVTDGFQDLAINAGNTQEITPAYVMLEGLYVSVKVVKRAKGVANTIGAVIIALIMIIIFALITAELVVVLVSMYVLLNAGIIMLAFGGSRWTEQFAINYYKTVLAIGVKLFITIL